MDTRGKVGMYPVDGLHLPGNSSIVDYGLGVQENLVSWTLEKAVVGVVRRAKTEKRFLTQKEAIQIGHEERNRIVQCAATLGTKVHSATYNHLNGVPQTVDSDADPYFNGVLSWLNQHEVQPIAMERLLWDVVEKYAGRFDFFGYVDGKMTIMDFKTNNTIQPKMGLQLAGYRHLLEVNSYVQPDTPIQMLILHIRPNHAYTIPFYETWETYKKVKDIFWWKFYRYNPEIYLRSPEAAVQNEMSPAANATRLESAQQTGTLGLEHLPEVLEILSTDVGLTCPRTEENRRTCSCPECISLREQGVVKRPVGRPRGKTQAAKRRENRAGETSSRRTDSLQRTRPEEEELDPTGLAAKLQTVRDSYGTH